MSVDRYISIRCPLRYNGRARTRRSVVARIAFVWVLSALICAALPATALRDLRAVYSPGARPRCVPAVREFVIYGSIVAFYIPLGVMVVAYALTVRRLRRNRSAIGRFRSGPGSLQKRPTLTQPSRPPSVHNGTDVVRGRIPSTLLSVVIYLDWTGELLFDFIYLFRCSLLLLCTPHTDCFCLCYDQYIKITHRGVFA